MSPFAFLRGTAAVMAQDLSPSPVTGLHVQVCGDMHVSNFGVFASAERSLVFGINDFDETIPGPWEWDLKRLVASAVVAGQFVGTDRRILRVVQPGCCEFLSAAYARICRNGIWPHGIRLSAKRMCWQPFRQSCCRCGKKGSQKPGKGHHLQVLEKMTDLVDNKQRIVENAPFIVRETQTQTGLLIREAIGLFLEQYLSSLAEDRRQLISRYQLLDVARKVVGVGSVGTRCWVVFLRGADEGDPLFLQFKEAEESVLAPYLEAPTYQNQGFRVVSGQRLIQGSPDILLGWGIIHQTHFYIRQLRDMKGSYGFDPATTTRKGMEAYCGLCGWALALAHAKSGDAAMISGYLGKTDEIDAALTKFAFAYSEQNQRDYEELQKAARSKRIEVAAVA